MRPLALAALLALLATPAIAPAPASADIDPPCASGQCQACALRLNSCNASCSGHILQDLCEDICTSEFQVCELYCDEICEV